MVTDATGEEALEVHTEDGSLPARRLTVDPLVLGRPAELVPSPEGPLVAVVNTLPATFTALTLHRDLKPSALSCARYSSVLHSSQPQVNPNPLTNSHLGEHTRRAAADRHGYECGARGGLLGPGGRCGRRGVVAVWLLAGVPGKWIDGTVSAQARHRHSCGLLRYCVAVHQHHPSAGSTAHQRIYSAMRRLHDRALQSRPGGLIASFRLLPPQSSPLLGRM